MEIIGHQKQWQFLKKSVEFGKISHAYLFSGQEKLGKKRVALEFVKLINGENFDLGHPDLILIEPKGGAPIQIAQIRELIQKLSLKPYSASFKVAIIDQAHLMTREAQHSFLKTLEEPKGKTLLILITEASERLLATIPSRCEIIKFSPVKEVEIKSYLRAKFSDKECEEASKFCLGRPGEAVDFISNPQKLENRKKIIKELIKISNSGLAFRFQSAKDLSAPSNLNHVRDYKSKKEPQREQIFNGVKEILSIWLSYFRAVLLSKVEDPDLYPNYSFSKLKNILSQIQNINFLLTSTNVNSRLALEILMLEL
jgi:DNA polymerase-3 subunit delta'